jgi:hypothetical protein
VIWYKDTPGKQNKRTTNNKGCTSRNKLTALSNSVQMMGKLHLDLICQNKYLLNHVDLKIKLRRSRDAFVLVADAANYINKIKEMALYVRKVQVSICFDKSNPNVVFPSFVPNCLGPSIYSWTCIPCYSSFSCSAFLGCLVPDHARQLRFFSRLSVTEKSLFKPCRDTCWSLGKIIFRLG